MLKKIIKTFAILSILFVCVLVSKGHPKFLKGTYSIFNEDFSHLSPIHGAIGWETDYFRRMWERGSDAYSTIKLVKKIYHLEAGNFDVTTFKSMRKIILPEKMGILIGAIEKIRRDGEGQVSLSHDEFKERLVQEIKIEKQIKDIEDQEKVLGKELKALNNNLRKLREEGNDASSLEQEIKTKAEEKEQLKQQRTGLQKRAIGVQDFGGGKGGRAALSEFLDDLTNSLYECGFFVFEEGYKALFAPFTTYIILLGVIYRNVESREYFETFFDSLTIGLGVEQGELFNLEKPLSDWLADIFSVRKKDDVKMYIDSQIKEQVEASDSDLLSWIYENYEEVVFNELMDQYYLIDIPIQSAHFYGTRFNGQTFTDCCENAVRAITNLMFYDAEQRRFDREMLLPDLADSVHEDIVAFYEKYSSADIVDNKEIHDDWAVITSNLPGVAYVKALAEDGTVIETQHSVPFIYFEGYEPEDIEEATLGGKAYKIVNPTKYKLYEIALDLRSLITIFSRFFGLNIFNVTREEYNNKEFNRTYFPLLMEKLSWSVEEIKPQKNEQALGMSDLDSYNVGVNIKFKTDKEKEFTLKITGLHAETVFGLEESKLTPYRKNLFERIFASMAIRFDIQAVRDLSLLSLYRRAIPEVVVLEDNSTYLDLFADYVDPFFNYSFFQYLYFLYPRYIKIIRGEQQRIFSYDETDLIEKAFTASYPDDPGFVSILENILMALPIERWPIVSFSAELFNRIVVEKFSDFDFKFRLSILLELLQQSREVFPEFFIEQFNLLTTDDFQEIDKSIRTKFILKLVDYQGRFRGQSEAIAKVLNLIRQYFLEGNPSVASQKMLLIKLTKPGAVAFRGSVQIKSTILKQDDSFLLLFTELAFKYWQASLDHNIFNELISLIVNDGYEQEKLIVQFLEEKFDDVEVAVLLSLLSNLLLYEFESPLFNIVFNFCKNRNLIVPNYEAIKEDLFRLVVEKMDYINREYKEEIEGFGETFYQEAYSVFRDELSKFGILFDALSDKQQKDFLDAIQGIEHSEVVLKFFRERGRS
jgi:hypothetical protein